MPGELSPSLVGYRVLEKHSLFRLEGADRIRYLNGQVSNDVTKASAASSIRACVLTAKGKLCAVIGIWSEKDALFVDAESSLWEALQQRLERYIIADDVTLIDITDSHSLIHAIGLPADFSEGVITSRFGLSGRDILVPTGELSAYTRKLEDLQLKQLSSADLDYFRILHGIPRWGSELDENTLPQEAGLEKNAVDFYKGCYVGQEVVSRIKSVGHVNRMLAGFESDQPLHTDMALASVAAPDSAVGKITSVSQVFGLSKWVGIGYLKRGFNSPDSRFLVIDPQTGSQTEVRPREFSSIKVIG